MYICRTALIIAKLIGECKGQEFVEIRAEKFGSVNDDEIAGGEQTFIGHPGGNFCKCVGSKDEKDGSACPGFPLEVFNGINGIRDSRLPNFKVRDRETRVIFTG